MLHHKTTVDVWKILQRDGWVCAYCGTLLNDEQITVDHVIPTLRGGPDTLENVTICCLQCNVSKSNMTADEYRHWRFLKHYVCDVAPRECIRYEAIEIKSSNGMMSVIALPELWYGGVLPQEIRDLWETNGAVMVGIPSQNIALLDGAMFEFFSQYGRNKTR